jgi:hypothetical protein
LLFSVIDFAFLFSYAKTLSTYYLVIEDDIISSSQYISAVKDFIKSRESHRWTALHFSGFLGIGLLFHNSDLPNLIRLLFMFHQEQPVDMLMRQFISLQVQIYIQNNLTKIINSCMHKENILWLLRVHLVSYKIRYEVFIVLL